MYEYVFLRTIVTLIVMHPGTGTMRQGTSFARVGLISLRSTQRRSRVQAEACVPSRFCDARRSARQGSSGPSTSANSVFCCRCGPVYDSQRLRSDLVVVRSGLRGEPLGSFSKQARSTVTLKFTYIALTIAHVVVVRRRSSRG